MGERTTPYAMTALMMVLLACGVTLTLVAVFARIAEPPTTTTYNGVTWTGHDCFIDDEGTLWCNWEMT